VRIDTDAADPFDGTASNLVYVENNTTNIQATQDLTGSFKISAFVDPPSITSLVSENGTNISKVRIYKHSASALPSTVDIYIGNSTDSDPSEGDEFVVVRTGYSFVDSTGNETIDVTDRVGKYVKIQTVTISGDEFMEFSDIYVEETTTTTEETTVFDEQFWEDALPMMQQVFFISFSVIFLGIAIIVLRSMMSG